MKLINKKSIPKETCFDISVENTNCFFANGVLVHNSNAGVRIKSGEVVAQSRSQTISVANDNVGFAKWVEERKNFFNECWFRWQGKEVSHIDITVFGEWCGPGIMKGTAINQIQKKVFVVFAIAIDNFVIVEPKLIDNFLEGHPEDIHILPWQGDAFMVNFDLRSNLIQVAETLNEVIKEIEPCDPWVKSTFGIEGTAEGIVYYPVNPPDHIDRKRFSELTFKAKGDKHKVAKTKNSVQIDPEVATSVENFVEMFVTEPRLEQGLATIGGVVNLKNTGNFLKWMSTDIIKESVDELEVANLTWEQVNKAVQLAARNWFLAKSKEI